jgi:hypothetical protein
MRSKMRTIYNIALFYMKIMQSLFSFFGSTKSSKTKRPHTKHLKAKRPKTKRPNVKRGTRKMRGG